MLPSAIVAAATKISYKPGSGYVTIDFCALADNFNQYQYQYRNLETTPSGRATAEALVNLVQHPPLCIYNAFVSIGEIPIPQEIFDSPGDFRDFVFSRFHQESQPQQFKDREYKCDHLGGDEEGNEAGRLGLRWQNGVSVLGSLPHPLAERLSLSNDEDRPRTASSGIEREHVTFRASFDRGDIKHDGVRSQDYACSLGDIAGKVFPSWKVDLKNFDVEVFGRLVQGNVEDILVKPEPNTLAPAMSWDENSGRVKNTCQDIRIQVGMALPLALVTCPYRYRPVDGRTSLKIETAYTLLAMADPKPGDIVIDMCSGVGTIPIIGAVHYPKSFFAGFEFKEDNVEKAAENSRGMLLKAGQDSSRGSGSPIRSLQPSLFVGDARAMCLRSGTVDLIVSDLPWGQRESTHKTNCKLYPKLVKEVIRMLRVNGRAVLVTGERKLLTRQLEAPFARERLRLLRTREITIGFKVMAFEIVKEK
ncbi:S-adenosyl-L-methionine-dependent methyltransferase [Dissophora ornata]|nr:S-adenosyl-L-methionine-dependent methyltransferase [Dissophora ornata]